jgi:CubicO group peptidase (beta-lactamase class C family)
MSLVSVDQPGLARVVRGFGARWTRDAADIETYLAAQVSDASHREVVGPLLAASGASGVVRVAGREVAAWGDPDVPEMAFSVTKSVVSIVAGLAFDDGLLVPDQPVHQVVDIAEFRGSHNKWITWCHLLQQSSQWEGELWGKPTGVDAQSFREGTEVHDTPPGEGWAYNDVRMNLLAYALTLLFRRSLSDVLRERVMDPVGASGQWSWHGYRTSVVEIDGRAVEVVSGGAHWGGGLFVPARDLALIGQLFLDRGRYAGRRLLSAEWIDQSWAPGPVKAEYGYLWWLNDKQIPWPGAPATGRSARGNGGRHLLWVDPARELVLASHWTEEPLNLIREVSKTVLSRMD